MDPRDFYYLPNVTDWPETAPTPTPTVSVRTPTSRTPDITPKVVLDKTATPATKRQVTILADGEIVPIIYGRGDTGGKIFTVTTHNDKLVLGVLWCLGECHAVERVLINGSVITSGVARQDYLGSPTQTAATVLVSAIPGYADTMTGSVAGEDFGLCYSVFTIDPGVINGWPRFIGTLAGRKIYDTRELCERSYYQGLADVATFRRIAWDAGTVGYAALEDNTEIYKNGVYVTTVNAYDYGTLTVVSGDEIRSCNRNPLAMQYFNGANMMSPAYRGREFVYGYLRYLPWVFNFYNDSETQVASVAVSYATGYSVNRDWSTNVVTTFQILPQELKTFKENWAETETYGSAHTVYIRADDDIMVYKWASGPPAGDFMNLVPVGDNAINPVKGYVINYATSNTGGSWDTTACYRSGGTAQFSLYQHADGGGGDGTPWLPTVGLGDEYLVHVNNGYLLDYAIACVNQCTVEVFDRHGMKVWQHKFPTASPSSAGITRPGPQSGLGEDRTNLLGATEDFTQGIWTYSQNYLSIENDNVVTAPRPGAFMSKVFHVVDSPSGSIAFAQIARNGGSLGSTVASGLYSALLWVQAGTIDRVTFGIYCSGGTGWVDGTGEIIYGPGVISPESGLCLQHFQGLSTTEPSLLRVTMTSTFNTPAGSRLALNVYPGGTITNSEGDSIYVWGAHLEDIHDLPKGHHPDGYGEVSGGTYGYIPNYSTTETTTRNWLLDTPAYFKGTAPFYLRSNDPGNQDEFVAEGWLNSNRDTLLEGISYKNASFFFKRYSKNPALITADFLSSKVFGANRDLGILSISSTANFCSAHIAGTTIPRWEMGLVLDRPAKIADWADTLRAYGNFFIYSYGSTLEFKPDQEEDTSNLSVFDENDIIDGTMRMRKSGVLKAPSVVRVNYTYTSATRWKDDYALAKAVGVDNGTEPWIESVIRMPGIQTYNQAYRQAVQRLNRLRLTDLELSFDTFDSGIFQYRGNLIKVTHPYGLTEKVMRVTAIENIRPGRWRVDCVEYQPNIYSNQIELEPVYPDTQLPGPWDIPSVSEVTLTEEIYQLANGEWASRIRIKWTPVRNYYYPFLYDIKVFRQGADTLIWGTLGNKEEFATTTDVLEYVTGAVRENEIYTVSVRVVNNLGVAGEPYYLPYDLQNWVIYSEQFETWSTVRCWVEPNVAIAPDKTLTADRIVDTTDIGSHYPLKTLNSFVTEPYVTWSFYAKRGEYDYIVPYLYARDSSLVASNYYYKVDLTNGTVANIGNVESGSLWFTPVPNSYSIEYAGDGWYRCSISAQLNPGAATFSVLAIMAKDSSGSFTTDNDGNKGVYLWGAQLEKRATLGDYVKTTSVPVELSNPRGTLPSISIVGKTVVPTDVPDFMGDEIGGTVRLWWQPAIDVDIRNYEIRYGTVLQEWEEATLIDRTDALRYETTIIPEGLWRFFIKARDSVGHYSVNASFIDLRVTTDTAAFSEYYNYTSYSEASLMSQYHLGRLDTVNRWITEDGEAWNDKYTSNLATYTNPLACYHTALPSKFTSEVWDVGYDITANFIGEIRSSCPAGGPVTQELLTQASGGSYVTTSDPMSLKATARYVKLNTYASGGATLKVFQPVFRTRLVSTPRLENGYSSTIAGSSRTVKLADQYIQVKSFNVTPVNVASARIAVVDNVVLDAYTTCSFDVWIFDTDFSATACDFTWEFYGI